MDQNQNEHFLKVLKPKLTKVKSIGTKIDVLKLRDQNERKQKIQEPK